MARRKTKNEVDLADLDEPRSDGGEAADTPPASDDPSSVPGEIPDDAAAGTDSGGAEKTRLEALEAEVAEYKDLALRARAELENYRKRMSRERAEQLRYAEQQLITDLLPVLDNFDRALAATPETDEGRAIREGLDMVKKSWWKVFQDHGIQEMNTENQPFDPALHEAVSRMERNDLPPNTIVQELQKGFVLHDRVIRAAQVIVSYRSEGAGPGTNPAEDPGGSESPRDDMR